MQKPKVTIIVPHENGVTYHRLTGPFVWLHERGQIELTSLNGLTKDHLDRVRGQDIVVFNRLIEPYPQSVETIESLKEAGIKVWCDVDDFWKLNPGHLLENLYHKTSHSDIIAASIMASDVVTCTHTHLAKKILLLNDNVHILPNAINFHEHQWKPTPNPAKKAFGWFGSMTHKVDIELLRRPMKRYWQSESTWHVLFGGFDIGRIKECDHVQDVLTAGWKQGAGRFLRSPGLPVEKYARIIDGITCGIVPLADNEFNRCKSELKVLEFAAKMRPVIVSNIHPYSNIANEDNAFLCDEPMDFYRHMMRVEKNPDNAAKKATLLHEQCRELYNWDKISYLRFQITKSLWH